MAKNRRIITFNDPQWEILLKIMEEDLVDNFSQIIGNLIAESWKSRQEAKSKRPVGRPRKSESDEEEEEEFDLEKKFADDLPKNIPWYGTMIGKKQEKYYEDLQKQFKSQG